MLCTEIDIKTRDEYIPAPNINVLETRVRAVIYKNIEQVSQNSLVRSRPRCR